jgi:hypothetical protein
LTRAGDPRRAASALRAAITGAAAPDAEAEAGVGAR